MESSTLWGVEEVRRAVSEKQRRLWGFEDLRRSVTEKQRRGTSCEVPSHVGNENPVIFSFFQEDGEDIEVGPSADVVREGQVPANEPPGFSFTNEVYRRQPRLLGSYFWSAPPLDIDVPKSQSKVLPDEVSSTEPGSSTSNSGDVNSKEKASDTSEDDSFELAYGGKRTKTKKSSSSGDNVNTGALSNRRSLCCYSGGGVLPDYEEHLGEGRQYWRDIILGVNDGLVSTFLLVAGVTGAHLSNTDILLTAVSGTIAGAISMAAGEYVATKTQEEVLDGEILLERKHIRDNRDEELEELREAFRKIGIPDDDKNKEATKLRNHLLAYYKNDNEAHLQVHAVLELGVIDEERRNPIVAGTVAFFLFFFGALPSVVPFAATDDISAAFLAAGIATTTGLFLVGAVKTWATRGSLINAALENLIIAAGGGGIAYGVGVLFDSIIRGG